MSVEETYQKKSPLEHILLRPDTYIGSVEVSEEPIWIWDDVAERIVFRKTQVVPGLCKIFDEILVNAADNKQRDRTNMTEMRVNIDATKGSISVFNNGRGIPVQMHQTEKMYLPELLFGNLLTSSNYDDQQQKTTGGRNGFGAKLANIFSTKFGLECQDQAQKKFYRQVWTDNMQERGEAQILDRDQPNSTKITFYPDLAKFGGGTGNGFDADTVAFLKKRCYDVAGTSDKTLKVYLDGKRITTCTRFKKYIELYHQKSKTIYHRLNERWEIGVSVSPEAQFNQVSFVNNICTRDGGTHVRAITDQVCKAIVDHLKKKARRDIKTSQVKNHL
jgi:DNA topoisomerase-2